MKEKLKKTDAYNLANSYSTCVNTYHISTFTPTQFKRKARAIVASEPTEVDDLRQLMNEHENVYVFDHDSISRLRLPNRGQQELLHKAGLYKKRIQTKEGQKVTLYIRQDYEVRAGNIFDTETKQLVCSLKDNLKRLSPF